MKIIKDVPKEIKTELKVKAKEINKVHLKLFSLMKECALKVFNIGELLSEIKYTYKEINFKDWIESNLAFSYTTANKYLKLYEYFYNNPDRLKELTIMEAYLEAGIAFRKELPAPEDEDGKIITYGDDEKDGIDDEELRTVFKRKTVSGITLDNYRVQAYQGELWGFRKGYGRFPVADLRIVKPTGLPEIEWDEMHRNVQIAFESYFAKLEEYEKNGAVLAPEDTRFGSLMKKKSEAAGKKVANPFDDNGPFAAGDAGFTVEPMQGDVTNSENDKTISGRIKKQKTQGKEKQR